LLHFLTACLTNHPHVGCFTSAADVIVKSWPSWLERVFFLKLSFDVVANDF
jgi:hypothetical protein